MLITNARVVTFGDDPKLIEKGAILIAGEHIAAVGESATLEAQHPAADAPGRRRHVGSARYDLRAHPFLRRLCPRHGHPRPAHEGLPRNPQPPVVAA